MSNQTAWQGLEKNALDYPLCVGAISSSFDRLRYKLSR